jgi:hypothetical protein
MKLSLSISASLIVIILLHSFVYAREVNHSLLNDVKQIEGEYRGEIRLQNVSGTVDRLLISNASLNVGIQKDELVVKMLSTTNRTCRAEVKGIRELVKNPGTQTQVLRALFDYDTSRCPSQKQWHGLLLYVSHEPDGKWVAETVLTRNADDIGNTALLDKDLMVHGIFIKDTLTESPQSTVPR